MKPNILLFAACLAIMPLDAQVAPPGVPTNSPDLPGLFDRQNLTAWCVVPFDAKKRGPEQRAEMLQRLGFKSFAYDWRSKDVPTFDAEMEALNKHGINLVAWWFPTDAGDPNARIILEVIKRHGIHPQLWVMGSGSPTKTEAEQRQRTDQEAERIRKTVELATPYGCKVELYNHNGWFGQPDNEVAVIERLKQNGVSGVGMIYNFSHGHGDVADFPPIWKRIQHYVVAVNVTGMVMDGRLIPPSQGDHELEMLRTIQQSGWRGPLGLIAEQGGDAEVTLGNNLRGLDWLRKELAHPGSGGARPRFNEDPGVPNPSTDGLPPRSLPTGPAACSPVGWVQTDLRIAHLPPADWRQIQEYFRAGYQVVAVNTLAQWDRVGPRSNDYPAQIVGEADAYLRRFVKIAHDAGGKAVFYLGPVQPALHSETFRAKHPDWLRVNEDGSRAKDYVNFRNPEVVNWLCEQLAYLAREYKADGFWFDGYSPIALHTYDEATRQAFKEFSKGRDIPRQRDLNPRDPLSLQYLQWHEAYFAELANKIRQAIRAANPRAVVYGNYSANRTWYEPGWPMGEYPAYYANAIDLPSVELYWDNPGDALFQQFVYAFTQGMSHDRGARVWVQPHVHGTMGTPPAVELLLRCLEGAPWGVYAEFVENAEREEYCHQYVSEVKAREEWWRQSEAVPYIGIVASEQTRLLMGKDTLPKYFSHTLGAFRALFEARLPLRVLSEYDLENADLQGIRVLVLPDVRVLSDRSSEVIRRFVKAGGGLVATCDTGLFDQTLKPRSNFSLADLFHADYLSTRELTTREESVSLWLAAPEHPIVNDDIIKKEEATAWRNPSGPPPERGALEMVASLTSVRPREGGQTLVSLDREPGKAATAPALLASTYGEGQVVYSPVGLDQAMFFYPNAFIGEILVNATKWAAGDAKPPVETDGPLILAVTYRRQPAQHRTIVHLLNDQSSYGRHSIYQKVLLPDHSLMGPWTARREVIPLHDIKVRCRVSGVTKATQEPESLDLPLKQLPNGTVEVVVPKIDMYSLVVFE